MPVNADKYQQIISELNGKATLVAVSKIKPVEDIQALYDMGQRDFGENYVQELLDKLPQLPADIRWHFIGHLQSNKVKYIASFVHLIHGVDSYNLLKEINKQAAKHNRVIDCLLQMHIAKEETKFGLDENELKEVLEKSGGLNHIQIKGLMGMGSFSDDKNLIRNEFRQLKTIFDTLSQSQSQSQPQPQPSSSTSNLKPQTLSMGMSSDYAIAIEEGSNMVRIGSLLFGERQYIK